MGDAIVKDSFSAGTKEYCDVLIVGAGIAGVSAALAAARNGQNVILLKREYGLGGMATLGLIAIYLPLCDGMGRQVSFGISEELLKLSIKYGADGPLPSAWLENRSLEERKAQRYRVQFNPNMFALLLEQLLKEAGVRILYGALATDVTVSDRKITEVMIETKSGKSSICPAAVIDCSGDADICWRAGVPTEVYAKGNGLASWYYYQSGGRIGLRMFGLADVTPDQTNEMKTQEKVKEISQLRFSGVDGFELSLAWQTAHEKMMEDIQEHRKKDPDYMPVSISSIPLVRMSRRLVGRETLDSTGYQESSIGMCGDWCKSGPVYEIPFGTLCSESVSNLLAAGRIISVSDPVWNVTRVIPPCAVTGEAAGTAAALTKDFNTIDIKQLQNRLRDQGVRIHENELESFNH